MDAVLSLARCVDCGQQAIGMGLRCGECYTIRLREQRRQYTATHPPYPAAQRAPAATCPSGHAYAEHGRRVRTRSGVSRRCGECRRIWQRAAYARSKTQETPQ